MKHVDTALNIKGKKMQLYRELRKGVTDKGSALHAQKRNQAIRVMTRRN